MILPASMSGQILLPSVPAVRANPAPTTPPINPGWIPAGPSMNTLTFDLFTDSTAMFTSLMAAAPGIDLSDSPMTPGMIAPCNISPALFCTAPVADHGYQEIEFNLANNFWGCNFNFGNSPCGVNIRQGIAHLIDKCKFVNTEPTIAGISTCIDNPEPPNGSPSIPNLTTPNACNWDPLFPEAGPNCITGIWPAPWTGGTAYHLGPACGVNFAWQPCLGGLDFCAAADHFIAAGLAAGKAANCVLIGLNAAVAVNTVNFFIRTDIPAKLHLGQSMAQEICALFTGVFIEPCAPFLTATLGPITAFPGFYTSKTGVSLSWHMYTADFPQGFPTDDVKGVYPFDASLYFTYNSLMVSGVTGAGGDIPPCSTQALPSFKAENYMYLCNSNYDQLSSAMEFAPCITPGPAAAVPVPTFFNCAGGIVPSPGPPFLSCATASPACTALSAGYQAEDWFGRSAFTIPVDSTMDQFAYLSNVQRVVNAQGTGIPNFYTWLDAWIDPGATVAGQIPLNLRQGLSFTTASLNPYIASTRYEFHVLGSIYDTLIKANPMENDQILCWMPVSCTQTFLSSGLTYLPPPGTSITLRMTLRNDVFWHDGRPVTSFDVAFSYLSLLANGAYQASSLLGTVAGVTILGPRQFDLNLRNLGPFTLDSVGTVTIIPGRYWNALGAAAWDAAVPIYPVQYTLGPTPPPPAPPPAQCALVGCPGFPAALMNANPAQTAVTFDPLASNILIGSGPWTCQSSTGVLGGGCSSSNNQSPPPGGSFTLTRFGCTQPGPVCIIPAQGVSNYYFRSEGNLALYIWTQNDGNPTHDLINISVEISCYGKPVGTYISQGVCHHWQEGIGNPNGPNMVLASQIAILVRFFGVSWIPPLLTVPTDWNSLTGIIAAGPGDPPNILTGAPGTIGGVGPLYEGGPSLTPLYTLQYATTTAGLPNFPKSCYYSDDNNSGGPPGLPTGGTPYPNNSGYDC